MVDLVKKNIIDATLSYKWSIKSQHYPDVALFDFASVFK